MSHEARLHAKLNKCRAVLSRPESSVTDITAAVGLLWQCFFVTGRRELLHEANHAAVTSFARKPGSIELLLALIFVNIELGNNETAGDHLRQLRTYRNFYKNNDHAAYALLWYFQAELARRAGNDADFAKAVSTLEDFVTERLSRGDLERGGFVMCVLGAALAAAGRHADSFRALRNSRERGYTGAYLYAHTYKLLGSKPAIEGSHTFLVDTFLWCVTRGLDIGPMLDFYAPNLGFAGRVSYTCYDALLSVCDGEWLLAKLVTRLLETGDYSRNACKYYRLAENRQLDLPGLANAVVRSAYRNRLDEISRHSLKQFLDANTLSLDDPEDARLAAYVYHKLLTTKKLADLAPAYHDGILEFACYACDNKLHDSSSARYVNSSYKRFAEYCIEFEQRNNISLTDCVLSGNKALASLAYYYGAISAKLWPSLFAYDLEFADPGVALVWVNEREKSVQQPYDVADGRARVYAADADFTFVCFTADMRRICECDVRVAKLTPRPNFDMLKACYNREAHSDNLLIALSRYFISLEDALDKSVRKAAKHADRLAFGVEILGKSLALTTVSESFTTRATAALGGICAALDNHSAALDNFAKIDGKYISDKHVEKMLEVYMEAARLEPAARLISTKPHCIKERTIFKALVRILTVANVAPQSPDKQALVPIITNVAYEMILKSWFDKAFLEVVIQYYRGTQEEWHALSAALHQLGADDIRVDEKIISDSLFTHTFSAGAQRVFTRLYANDPRHALVAPFLEFGTYECMVRGTVPDHAVIDIMERQFIKYGDIRLGCGLVYAYLEGGVSTSSSDYILRRAFASMQSRGVLLPPFRLVKDKSVFGSYLVKNTPFTYRTQPGKDVYLAYRYSQDADFARTPMNYLFFGIYTCHIVQFSGENIEYYFSEISKSGSVDTKPATMACTENTLREHSPDPYFMLNNALIYEQMFRYDKVEELVADYLRDYCMIKSQLL
ncbi:MAG: DUF5717 family protein [Defluviitaleaceae bacterium]|nr:DUF5717 family protein [Defluviitaleaceae bacterium]